MKKTWIALLLLAASAVTNAQTDSAKSGNVSGATPVLDSSDPRVAKALARIEEMQQRTERLIRETMRSGKIIPATATAEEAEATRAELRRVLETGTEDEVLSRLYAFIASDAGIPDFKVKLLGRLSKTADIFFCMEVFELLTHMDHTPEDLLAMIELVPGFDDRVNGPNQHPWCGTGKIFIGSELIRPIVKKMGPAAFTVLGEGATEEDPLAGLRRPEFLREQFESLKKNPKEKLGIATWLSEKLFFTWRSRTVIEGELRPTSVPPEIQRLRKEFLDLMCDWAINPPPYDNPMLVNGAPETAREKVLLCLIETAGYDPDVTTRVRLLFKAHPEWNAVIRHENQRFNLDMILGNFNQPRGIAPSNNPGPLSRTIPASPTGPSVS